MSTILYVLAGVFGAIGAAIVGAIFGIFIADKLWKHVLLPYLEKREGRSPCPTCGEPR